MKQDFSKRMNFEIIPQTDLSLNLRSFLYKTSNPDFGQTSAMIRPLLKTESAHSSLGVL